MELHVNLAELLGFLFKTHGEAFFPAFQELLLPSVLEMARPDSLAEDRKVSACAESFLRLFYFTFFRVEHGRCAMVGKMKDARCRGNLRLRVQRRVVRMNS